MAQVYPFRGFRYDIAQVGDLSDVTCPPYDVIDGAFQERAEALAKDERARLSSTQLVTYFLGSVGMWSIVRVRWCVVSARRPGVGNSGMWRPFQVVYSLSVPTG